MSNVNAIGGEKKLVYRDKLFPPAWNKFSLQIHIFWHDFPYFTNSSECSFPPEMFFSFSMEEPHSYLI